MTRVRAALAGLLASLLFACERPQISNYNLKRAQFGVLFGGEVQELSALPLELDQTRQTIGIRLSFAKPPDPPLKVHWELERPRKALAPPRSKSARAADAGPPDAGPSGEGIVEFGDVSTRPGQAVLDIPLAFRPGDPLGDWSVRVDIQGQRVLNRPFRVVPSKPARKSAGDEY